jgi:hypothetical protein
MLGHEGQPMCNTPLMDFYTEHIHTLESTGASLLDFECPYSGCGFGIKTGTVAPGLMDAPLSTCPSCERFFWKIVQHGRACGLRAHRATVTRAVGALIGPLGLPIPESRSDVYAAGWAYADGYLKRGGDLAVERVGDWLEDKAKGFWERLAAERQRKS